MAKNNLTLPDLKRTVIGGAAAPRAMLETFEKKYNVPVVHAWGMTETSPVGLVCTMKPKHASLTFDQQLQLKGKQGRPIFGVEFSIVDDDGKEVGCVCEHFLYHNIVSLFGSGSQACKSSCIPKVFSGFTRIDELLLGIQHFSLQTTTTTTPRYTT